ncbi:SMC-Scp complex subunit ScpB [Halothiobacillus diazotrophicus]|uniref:SMC-Scp complex subunit ScpB n=1 Tax=Halothiobacillus diazotrophicus TaxID=1860122 RepID=A0A191ZJI3_9GAMM|nr:SMC-Scp complex subunit ScpB [Halothiobacillus diazotrophicus]ANJ68007.1 SMC-Scp complex subunit ScpB [Halothiobacillus diazotrophicus]
MTDQPSLLPGDETADSALAALIEALLMASDEPLDLTALQRMIGAETPLGALQDALRRLDAQYASHPFIDLKTVTRAGQSAWRLTANAQLAPYIARSEPPRASRYSRAVLETLALIAWRQPISRGEIEAVRGVAVNPQILRTLSERGWIRVVGHKDTPGRPELLGTTPAFLADFGLDSLEQLPAFDQFVGQGALDV